MLRRFMAAYWPFDLSRIPLPPKSNGSERGGSERGTNASSRDDGRSTREQQPSFTISRLRHNNHGNHDIPPFTRPSQLTPAQHRAALEKQLARVNGTSIARFRALAAATNYWCPFLPPPPPSAASPDGAKTAASTITPLSPLHRAVLDGNKDHVRQHARVFAPDIRDAEGKTPLIYAVLTDRVDLVRLLVGSCGASVNAADNEGRTPCHFAVYNAKAKMLTALLKMGMMGCGELWKNASTMSLSTILTQAPIGICATIKAIARYIGHLAMKILPVFAFCSGIALTLTSTNRTMI